MSSIANFIQHIEFPFLAPQQIPNELIMLVQNDTFFQNKNTRIPAEYQSFKTTLQPLLEVPKQSTLAIGLLFQFVVNQMDTSQAFVNVGTRHGFSLFAGMIGHPDKICIGVDNFSEKDSPRSEFYQRFARLKSPQHLFYEMDYKVYFSEVHQGQIGCYFYDGEHTYEEQFLGLKLAEPFLAKDCIIFVDDTNWVEASQATLDFMEQSPHQYELLLDVKTSFNGHPTYWNGLMILQKLT